MDQIKLGSFETPINAKRQYGSEGGQQHHPGQYNNRKKGSPKAGLDADCCSLLPQVYVCMRW